MYLINRALKIRLCNLLLLFNISMLICQSSYQYDQNGNLITDHNKNINSIIYNVLNLPEEILFSDGRKIINTYTADREKVSQETILADGSIHSKQDYLDNIVYNSNQLEYINTAEGYIEPDNNQFSYTYQHKDQVGNIRASFSDSDRDGIADLVKEEKNYYPFGLQWQQPNSVIRGRKHNYGYGGKEEITAFGLDWNDHGARMYDPAIARWNGIDQLAEKYVALSPYHYVAGNPILFNDPDGKDLRIHYVENGKEKSFVYKGGAPKNIPNNKFVKQVIMAYNYNVTNGGGDNLKKLAESDKLSVNIVETDCCASYSRDKTIRWAPTEGTILPGGYKLSPATGLEHEAAHAYLHLTDPEEIERLTKIKLKGYGNAEEKRVMTGAERKTAIANGELKKDHPGRKNHEPPTFTTVSPISTKEKPKPKPEKNNDSEIYEGELK